MAKLIEVRGLKGATDAEKFDCARSILEAVAKRWIPEEDEEEDPDEAEARLEEPADGRIDVSKVDELDSPSANDDEIGSDPSDVIEPPFSFETLALLRENSSPLGQNAEAMATNIDGFGHTYDPILDFEDPTVTQDIRDAMLCKGLADVKDLADVDAAELAKAEPSDKEVEDLQALWSRVSVVEKARLDTFFDFLNPTESFIRIRKMTRRSMEILGNAGWEVIREDPTDIESKIAQVHFIKFTHVRMRRSDKKPTKVDMIRRVNMIDFETVPVERFFRRFIRKHPEGDIHYKEFGDPRIMSRKTGNRFKDLATMVEAEDENAKTANEFFHWKIDSLNTPYGIPRWIGSLLEVLGSRAANEVNFLYFDNKACPPMVILVSGGTLGDNSVEKIQEFLEDRTQGRANFHKALVLEGVPAGSKESAGDTQNSGKLRIEFVSLFGKQQQDAQFQEYEEANQLKIGRSFRLPKLLTGDTGDMNRATAEVAKAFAEEQVFQPERDEFDSVMDRHFLPNLKVRFWRFKTRAPVQRIPNELVRNVVRAATAGLLTANEARKLLSDAFSVGLKFRTEEWAALPPPLAKAAARGVGGAPSMDNRQDQIPLEKRGPVLIARGRTATHGDDGHSHAFVAVSIDGEVMISTFPSAGHNHGIARTKAKEGEAVDVETGKAGDPAHGHGVQFMVPFSPRRMQALKFVNALAALRDLVEDANDDPDLKDDWFGSEDLEGERVA